jgi:hypothetical protein
VRIWPALAIAATFTLQAPGLAQTASLDLLRRAADPNPTLKSYTASAQLSATLHAPVPIQRTFNGTVYYLKPRRKIEFQSVSGPLSRFKDLTSSTPTYDEAVTEYTIAPLTDNGSTSTYSLVPKKAGERVTGVTVGVDDQSALIVHAEWSYSNGGKLILDQSYATVGDFHLPSKATIAARFPGYSVDGTLTFANYKPNATVSPSVFENPS